MQPDVSEKCKFSVRADFLDLIVVVVALCLLCLALDCSPFHFCCCSYSSFDGGFCLYAHRVLAAVGFLVFLTSAAAIYNVQTVIISYQIVS